MAKPAQLPHSRQTLPRMMRIHEEFQDSRVTNCTKLAELLEVRESLGEQIREAVAVNHGFSESEKRFASPVNLPG
jgi:hypothetical protein